MNNSNKTQQLARQKFKSDLVSPNIPDGRKDGLTLEQMLYDFGRSSLGLNSGGERSSIARLNKIIELDLNSIEFNTPPREQEVEIEYF
jgi:hypothetical protein